MSANLSVTELVRNFSEFINRVAYRGERFILLRGGRPVGELRPLPARGRLEELPAILDALPRLDPVDAAAFESDLVSAREALDEKPLEDRWDS